MTLDFNKPFTDFDGNPIEGVQTMGKTLSMWLANAPAGSCPALKFYDWAKLLHSGKPLEVDRDDCNTLKRFIETHQQISVHASQLLLAIISEANALPIRP